MKQLVLDEKMVRVLLVQLGEIPAKYSMDLIGMIKATFEDQNKELEETETT